MRGQAVVEFAILFGVVLLLAAILLSFMGRITAETSEKRHERAVNAQLENVKNEVTAAALARDGYRYELDLYPRFGVLMNVTIDGSFVHVESSNYENAVRIPEVNGTVTMGTGTITITNTNGTVNVV